MLLFFHQFVNKLKSTPARKNRTIIISTILGFIINLFIWGLIYYKFYPLVRSLPIEQSFIPLHYNIYLGVDLFGNWQKIFMLPGLGLLIFTINTILALSLYNKKQIISYFLTIISSLTQIFLLISTILTILIKI